jgi:sporulation protein YlmC with PRC-barrel domain
MSNPVISSKKVQGTTVYNPQGDKLGSIDDVVIDKLSGQVRYAALEFGGFFGLGAERYPLPWRKLSYSTALDGYVVPLTKAELDGAPNYPADKLPEYSEEYGRKVHDYYGVPWVM